MGPEFAGVKELEASFGAGGISEEDTGLLQSEAACLYRLWAIGERT